MSIFRNKKSIIKILSYFFSRKLLYYSLVCPLVGNAKAEMWFSPLLFKIDRWNFSCRFSVQMSVQYMICLDRRHVCHAPKDKNILSLNFCSMAQFVLHSLWMLSSLFLSGYIYGTHKRSCQTVFLFTERGDNVFF